MARPEQDFGWNATVLIVAHVAMVGLLKLMLSDYPRDAYVLGSTSRVLWFALLSTPPVVVGLAARKPHTAVLIALVHALSPLGLLGILRTPGEDLNFMMFVWWAYVPAIAGIVLGLEHLVLTRSARSSAR